MEPVSVAEQEKPLSVRELGAWRGFLRVHATLTRAMSEGFEHKFRLTLSEYEVMLKVATAKDGAPRLNDIAERTLLTVSGLSRLVDRLERRGLVARGSSEQDGRARTLSLTDDGKVLFEEVHAAHTADVRAMFLSRLSVAEQKQLAALWERML
jgi:DNA-binding MarR family transcriptional regulator